MRRILREAMEAGCCGRSVQYLGKDSVQRDYDGEPMVTDTMAREDLFSLAAELHDVVVLGGEADPVPGLELLPAGVLEGDPDALLGMARQGCITQLRTLDEGA